NTYSNTRASASPTTSQLVRSRPRERTRSVASVRFRSVSDERDTGLEALLRLVPYFKDLDRVSLARLAGALDPMTVAAGPVITRAVATLLDDTLDRRHRALVGAPTLADPQPLTLEPARPRPLRSRIVGGALAIIVPLVLAQVPPPAGLSVQGWHILLVLGGAGIAWLTEPVPDFAVALAMAI